MNTSNTVKTDAGNIDKNTQPSAEMLDLSRTQLAQILKQGTVADHDLVELVYEVATQVVMEHGRHVQLFLGNRSGGDARLVQFVSKTNVSGAKIEPIFCGG